MGKIRIWYPLNDFSLIGQLHVLVLLKELRKFWNIGPVYMKLLLPDFELVLNELGLCLG
jgi:hypothetical protein